jgi:predicted permease
MRNQLAGPVRKASWALAGMAFLLVMAACANVAHLLLARATERRSELAVRAALGASRARLSQQLVTEASALTFLSATLGLFIARWICGVANSFLPPALASQTYAVLDVRVLGLAAALALCTGIALGALPATLVGRSLAEALRTRPGTAALAARRTHSLLVALQACLALVLIFGALTLGGAFLRLSRADLGFRTTNVVTASVSLAGAGLPNSSSEWQYYSEVLNRLRSIPGIEGAGAVSYLPLSNQVYMVLSFKLDTGQNIDRVVINASMPGYFNAIGTRIIAGRDFTFHDQLDREQPVIVNEAFAAKSGLGSSALGRHIQTPWNAPPYVVVGIAGNEKFAGPEQAAAEPQIFWPIEEDPPPALTFVARVANNPDTYAVRIRDAIRSVNPRVAVYEVKSLAERRTEVLAKPRFYTTATLFLALLAVLLAGAAIYGTSLYSIAQRKHEMGVRMALGASQRNLRTALLRESLFPVITGLVCGIPATIASTRIVMHFLFEAEQPAARIVAGAATLMFAIAVFAAWRAGARVLSIDPLEAIRAE